MCLPFTWRIISGLYRSKCALFGSNAERVRKGSKYYMRVVFFWATYAEIDLAKLILSNALPCYRISNCNVCSLYEKVMWQEALFIYLLLIFSECERSPPRLINGDNDVSLTVCVEVNRDLTYETEVSSIMHSIVLSTLFSMRELVVCNEMQLPQVFLIVKTFMEIKYKKKIEE